MNQLELRDIHLPDAVSWWPLAPGWWLLGILILLILFIFPKIIKRIKSKPINRTALLEFKKIEYAFQQHQDNTRLAQDISVLLRRICISYKSREDVASLTGYEWLSQLNKMTNNNAFSEQIGEILFNAPYQKQSQFNSNELINSCKNWIKQLPRRMPE